MGAGLPDLAQLKIAAESGDAKAQYEYAGRISFSNQPERIAWIQKSAEQGYAPAQDAFAEYLGGRYIPDAKKKKALDREAVRWASRAAYQGLASAQGRLGGFYNRGVGVAKDSVKAYMWAQIAVQTSGGDHGTISGLMYKANRDVLIANTSSEIISEGQRLAAAFKPTSYGLMNPVEADLIFSELRLLAIYEMKDTRSAVLNNVRFNTGETKEIKLDEQTLQLTCLAIEGKAARFAIAETNYQSTIALKR